MAGLQKVEEQMEEKEDDASGLHMSETEPGADRPTATSVWTYAALTS